MDLKKQTLTSPNYPKSYFPDTGGCDWLITAPEGNIIYLEFDYFNVSKKHNLCIKNIYLHISFAR